MATATFFKLDPALSPIIGSASNTAAAQAASDLLNENQKKYDVHFNERGFHNHSVHAILSLYASGANVDQIRTQFGTHATYMRPPHDVDSKLVEALQDPDVFVSSLKQPAKYSTFLVFFQGEIERKGWKAVLYEYLFKGDKRSTEMLWLFFEGVLHPIIHAGLAVEFQQPALVAEALAMAAITPEDFRSLMLDSERQSQQTTPGSKSLFEIVDKINAQPEKFDRHGPLMTDIAASYRVDPNNIEEAIKENINFSAWLTFGAWKSKTHRSYDINFFLMHSLNCSFWLSALLVKGGPSDWLGDDNVARARILEYKGRSDLYFYVWQRMPEINLDWVLSYQPKDAAIAKFSWDDIFARIHNMPRDDGHLDKMIRALAHGEALCGDGEGHPKWRFAGKDIWLKAARLGLDTTLWDFEGFGRLVSPIGQDPAIYNSTREPA